MENDWLASAGLVKLEVVTSRLLPYSLLALAELTTARDSKVKIACSTDSAF